MIQSKNVPCNTSWKFSPLDAALSGMVNSGSWLYRGGLDIDKLKDSLAETLEGYSVFAGRIASENSISTNNAGVEFEVVSQSRYSCEDVKKIFPLPDIFKVNFDIKACKKGKFPIMAVKVSQLSDGTLIHVAVNHLCADGASLFRFVSDWAKNYNGQPVTPVVFNQDLFPKPKHDLKELTAILQQKNWCKVGLKDLFPMIFDRIQNGKVVAQPIFVSYAFLNDLRIKYSISQKCGNHALICAFLGDILFKDNVSAKESCSVVSVVNLRGRAIYPEDYIGNAVMSLSSEDFEAHGGMAKTAEIIQNSLQKNMDKEKLEETFQLYAEAMILKAPFVPFHLKNTYGKQCSCIIINDFSSFDIYGICFGDNSPIKVYPNDLPDNIKIWPAEKQEQGFYFLFRGNLAKRMRCSPILKQ